MFKILLSRNATISVSLRNGKASSTKPAEVILDLGRKGNWIRGFEMIGGMFDFSLQKAVEPFAPAEPKLGLTPNRFTVTYDNESDAAYFYLEYGKRYRQLNEAEKVLRTEYSHSISPTALTKLDNFGGLVAIEFSVADSITSGEDFLYLFDFETEGRPL